MHASVEQVTTFGFAVGQVHLMLLVLSMHIAG